MKSCKKYAVMAVVAAWAAMTFLCVFAEDNPDAPMSGATFVAIKLLAIISLLGLMKFCDYASKKGLL